MLSTEVDRGNHHRGGISGAAAHLSAIEIASHADFLCGGDATGGAGKEDFAGFPFLKGLNKGAVVVYLTVICARGDSYHVGAASERRHHHMVGAPIIHRHGLLVEQVGTAVIQGNICHAVALESGEGLAVGGDFHAGKRTWGTGDKLIAFALHQIDGQRVAGISGIVYQVAREHHSERGVVEGGHKSHFGTCHRGVRGVSHIVLHDVLGAQRMGGMYKGEIVALEFVILGKERDRGGGGDVQSYTFGLSGVGLFAYG